MDDVYNIAAPRVIMITSFFMGKLSLVNRCEHGNLLKLKIKTIALSASAMTASTLVASAVLAVHDSM